MTNEVLVRPCQFGNPVGWAAKNAKEQAALLPLSCSSLSEALQTANLCTFQFKAKGTINKEPVFNNLFRAGENIQYLSSFCCYIKKYSPFLVN
jgi:hypothetical protein